MVKKPKKGKPKRKRVPRGKNEPPVKIDASFEDAMDALLKVPKEEIDNGHDKGSDPVER